MKPRTFLAGLIGVTGAAAAGLWAIQRRLIYFPGPHPGPAPDGWEDLAVTATGGLELTSWLRRSGAEDPTLVVVFPGNGGNRADRLALGDALAGRGYCVVLAEYRGYGGNPGTPDEAGIIADGAAAVAAARGACLTATRVVYFGESLGTAVAIAVSIEDPPDALVLRSPFTSLADVARVHYPAIRLESVLRDRYPSLERASAGALAGVPVLVIAGTGDTVIPYEQSRSIAVALGADTFTVPGADHNDASISSSAEMVGRVDDFVREAFERPPGGA